MGLMSEGSLPPFKYLDPRRYPAKLRDAAGRLIERFRQGARREEPRDESGTAGGSAERPASVSENVTYPKGRGINTAGGDGIEEADRERAAAALREFLAENVTNVERAARKQSQAERLEREGIPSDSARNRAERAREEVVDGLARLRRSLYDAGEESTARALEREVTKLDPPIEPEEIRH